MLTRLLRNSGAATEELVLHPSPRQLTPLRFASPDGSPTSLASWRGRVVLLNFWATWCAPCVKEMASLDHLQAILGGPAFEVIALSIDTGGLASVRSFFTRQKIGHLRIFVDAFADASSGWTGTGLPLTVLIDREGREIARHLGAATWDRQSIVQLLQRQVLSAGR